MAYFLIQSSEDGIYTKQFSNNEEFKSYLESYFSDEPVLFLDHLPDDLDSCLGLIAIKGEVIIPKPATIIKTFEIE